ncbi:Uma2 family endonuclease [Aquisphaera insulae]|uniref:Uma2 family endonuclease n=1 Tax=Aquisphaera insulae TaxID=2712864 RepID=UPI0013EC9311|nr:Uma2 family endonuclease [Aquisphaera insulae]
MTRTIGQAATVSAPVRPRRMTVAEYQELIESGIIDEKAPVVLIEGRIVGKMTKGTRHSASVGKVKDAIAAATGPGWVVRVEAPVVLPGRDSEPEPDVAVVRGVHDDYEGRDPEPADVALVVEVADSSLKADRELSETYLGGGLSVYWIVNIPDRRLEVYRSGAEVEVLAEGQAVELALDGKLVARIAVVDLLPRRPKSLT